MANEFIVKNGLIVSGTVNAPSYTGSLLGTASSAAFIGKTPADAVANLSASNQFRVTQQFTSDIISTGSITAVRVTASFIQGVLTGSVFGSATTAQTASRITLNSLFIAKEIHVSSGSGNDSMADGTILNPFKTIAAALLKATSSAAIGNQNYGDGHTIYVHPGLYPETINTTKTNFKLIGVSADESIYPESSYPALPIMPKSASVYISGTIQLYTNNNFPSRFPVVVRNIAIENLTLPQQSQSIILDGVTIGSSVSSTGGSVTMVNCYVPTFSLTAPSTFTNNTGSVDIIGGTFGKFSTSGSVLGSTAGGGRTYVDVTMDGVTVRDSFQIFNAKTLSVKNSRLTAKSAKVTASISGTLFMQDTIIGTATDSTVADSMYIVAQTASFANVQYKSTGTTINAYTGSGNSIVFTAPVIFQNGYTSAVAGGTAVSSSYVSGSNVDGTVGSAYTASYIETASYSTYALTASFAVSTSYMSVTQSNQESASWASQSLSASYWDGTASYALDLVGTASLATTSSYAETSSWAINSINAETASIANTVYLADTASFAYTLLSTASDATNAATASYLSGSRAFVNDLTVYGTASITYLYVQYQSSSVVSFTGSNQFGSDASGDTQQLTGSVGVTGSFVLDENTQAVIPNLTGSIFGSSSYALTASYLVGGFSVDTASYAQNAQTASYVSGSNVKGAVSLAYTASYVSGSNVKGAVTSATNATFATLVNTLNTSTNTDFTVLLAPTGTNGYVQTYTDNAPGVLYNPNTNRFTATNLSATGSLLGTSSNANTASQAETITVNAFTNDVDSYVLYSNTNAKSGVAIAGGALRYNAFQNKLTAYTVFATSFSGSLTGSVLGTASYAITASYILGGATVESASYASYAVTASYVATAQTASYVVTAQTASLLAGTASQAYTASFVTTARTASYVATAQTASYVAVAQTASFVTGSNVKGIVSSSITSSNADTASTAETLKVTSFTPDLDSLVLYANETNKSGLAIGASQLKFNGWQNKLTVGSISASLGITGSLLGTASYATTALTASYVAGGASGESASYASYAVTASYVATAQTASRVSGSNVVGTVSSSFTASLADTAITASYIVTAQTASFFAGTASQAYTASYVATAQTASYVATAQTASYAVTASYILGGATVESSSYAAYAVTASYVATAQTASYVVSAITASYVATAQTASFVASSSYAGKTSFADSTFINNIASGDQGIILTSTGSTGYKATYFDSNFRYGPATGKLTVTQVSASSGFTGNLTGNATSANTASVVSSGVTTAPLYLAGFNNANPVGQGLYFTTSFKIVANSAFGGPKLEVTGGITVTNGFTGSLVGTASWSTTALTASYAALAQTASFLSGSVSNAITAQTASTADTVLVSDASGLNSFEYELLLATGSEGRNTVYHASKLKVNPFSGFINATTFSGSLTGVADTASFVTASNVRGTVASSSVANSIFSTDGVGGSGTWRIAGVGIAGGVSNVVSTASMVYYASSNTLLFENGTITASNFYGLARSASYVQTAQTASFFNGNSVSASFATNAASASKVYVQHSSGPVMFLVGAQSTGSAHSTLGAQVTINYNPTEHRLTITGSMEATLGITGSITGSSFGTLNGASIDSAAWTAFTPDWHASSTNPSIGNGTITGQYKVIGKTCFYRGRIKFGTTTTAGNGAWYIGLPVTASSAYGIQMPASILDDGNAWYTAQFNGGRAGFPHKSEVQWAGTDAKASGIGSTVPFTWGNSDEIAWNGTFEIA